ncbi:hypothetical protein A6V39_00510 [Candidatus Mycoplasma haematobovis]|uniref:Uncharacterized protein n=1 Tax=Candidatus Mycoplasma haematobovis TaxID=432608 RepID=A0A1A9QD68_9MOLU|nr:hypothetical protein [Candidatus Mycoplasma haematobovis]OAL10532.1 hypothetical protein A6V39_00510 [Candidatus Mycoplasma haematobovis]
MTLKTVSLSALGASTIGGAAVGGYLFTKSSDVKKVTSSQKQEANAVSIQKQIETSGRTMLNTSESKHWNIKVNTYKTKLQSAVTLTSEDEEGLKTWCTETLKVDFKNERDNNYSHAEQLCTVPTNEEKLLSESKQLAEENDWEERARAYNTGATDENLISSINKNSADKTNLKEWCEKTFKEEISETGNTYIAAKQWCTKTQ